MFKKLADMFKKMPDMFKNKLCFVSDSNHQNHWNTKNDADHLKNKLLSSSFHYMTQMLWTISYWPYYIDHIIYHIWCGTYMKLWKAIFSRGYLRYENWNRSKSKSWTWEQVINGLINWRCCWKKLLGTGYYWDALRLNRVIWGHEWLTFPLGSSPIEGTPAKIVLASCMVSEYNNKTAPTKARFLNISNWNSIRVSELQSLKSQKYRAEHRYNSEGLVRFGQWAHELHHRRVFQNCTSVRFL